MPLEKGLDNKLLRLKTIVFTGAHDVQKTSEYSGWNSSAADGLRHKCYLASA